MVVDEGGPSLRSAVELRLGKIRGRLPQNLVRALQLADFALQLFQPLALVGRQAGCAGRRRVRPAAPTAAASPSCIPASRRSTRSPPTATDARRVLAHQPNARSRTSGEYRLGRAMGSILSTYMDSSRCQACDHDDGRWRRCSRISGLVVEQGAPGHDGQSLHQGPIEWTTSRRHR